MPVFAVAEEASGWAVIATLAALLLTFLTTARRDRMRGESDAVARWKLIADTAVADRDELEVQVGQLLREKAEDKATIAGLREELRHPRPRRTDP